MAADVSFYDNGRSDEVTMKRRPLALAYCCAASNGYLAGGGLGHAGLVCR